MGNGLFSWVRGRSKSSKPPKLELYNGPEVLLNPKVFGEHLKSHTIPVSFVFGSGGVGDYINWCSAIEYVAKENPHVDGRVFTSSLFIDVVTHLFSKYPRWGVYRREIFNEKYEAGSPVCFPKPSTQLINACGAHLMDLGFMYYACLNPPPPKYAFLPEIDYEGPWKWPELDPKSKYAIFTPGATAGVREMPVKGFDEIVAYAKKKGFTPVFLGKRGLSLDGEYVTRFANYDLSAGIDLRERTNLLEAVQIIRGAQFICGLDNGLLHMAGTTDTPIIFGHNIATVEHRQIRRRKGMTVNVTVDPVDLPCIGCQSRMRYLIRHDFRTCFFKGYEGDSACLTHLFENNSAKWKQAIDAVIQHGKRR